MSMMNKVILLKGGSLPLKLKGGNGNGNGHVAMETEEGRCGVSRLLPLSM